MTAWPQQTRLRCQTHPLQTVAGFIHCPHPQNPTWTEVPRPMAPPGCTHTAPIRTPTWPWTPMSAPWLHMDVHAAGMQNPQIYSGACPSPHRPSKCPWPCSSQCGFPCTHGHTCATRHRHTNTDTPLLPADNGPDGPPLPAVPAQLPAPHCHEGSHPWPSAHMCAQSEAGTQQVLNTCYGGPRL